MRRCASRGGSPLFVELPPVAAQAPDGHEPLEPVAEGHEGAGADHPGDLPLPLLVPGALGVALALEQEAARHAVGVALDRQRVALARRRPQPRVLEPVGARRLLARALGGEQRAVAHEVGVAADGRREVAVAGEREAGVPQVARRCSAPA